MLSLVLALFSALGTLAVSAVMFGAILMVGFLQALVAGTIFYWLWERLGEEYFYFLPSKYILAPWWDIVLLTWLFLIIGSVLFKSTVSSSDSKSEE